MNFYTLNQLINLIEQISLSHAQVGSFGFGEESNISTQQEKYPLVWANVLTSNITDKTLTVNMSLLVCDIVRSNDNNERDTLSDCLSIAQDIYAALTNPLYGNDFELQYNSNIEPVREGLPDVVNGWRLTLAFDLMQNRNRCQIPTKLN